MEWRDSGTILSARPHGETSMIVEAFTANHGRHMGIVRGGVSRKMSAILQPGSHVALSWHARLHDQIGAMSVEPLASRAGALSDRMALAGLSATCAMLHLTLPERAPHPDLYARTEPLFDVMGQPVDGWQIDYLLWEANLLETLGYGLDLTRCAITGDRDDLAYVSPRTGRAVGRAAAGEWASRLLPLPQILLGQGNATWAEIHAGLRVTGHFLSAFAAEHNRPLPEARNRLLTLLARQG